MNDSSRNFNRSDAAEQFAKRYPLTLSSLSPTSGSKSLGKYKAYMPSNPLSPQFSNLASTFRNPINMEPKAVRLLSTRTIEKLPGLSVKQTEPKHAITYPMHTINLTPASNLPKMEPSKISNKKAGVIKAYAANTHQGTIR